MEIRVFVPFASDSEESPLMLTLSVCRAATVEQVIGYILFDWIESQRVPKLLKKQERLAHWSMRIVEDDGTIDEDFPALDRARPIERFMFDAFALCENSKDSKSIASTPSESSRRESIDNSIISSNEVLSSANPLSSGMKLFIRVHLYSTTEIRHTTTLNVTSSTLLSTIMEAVCKKRSVNPKEYVLKLPDLQTLVLEMDKPFSTLGNVTELFLLKKSMGMSAGDVFLRPPGEMPNLRLNNVVLARSNELTQASAYKVRILSNFSFWA
jgi:hypothetical protein